ncbi:catabolic enzyme [Bordetella ansorpii]|uniref:Catabolic enzyme n=1 Tax=Bordetella ansorpii TaxID=288768 RepID=A0A157SVK2_9BORD|nr:MmgE/PrpD family protein [Bordetella ansorpii]SAI74469.1 catabolic enzyme [Bordetella ansorpii]
MTRALLEELADYAHGIDYEQIPQPVVEQAVLTVADTVACMTSGAHAPEAEALIRSERQRAGAGNIGVIGSAVDLPAEGAARVNAYMGDIHELNDLTCGHSGIGNVAAVLAMAESVGASGRALISALVTGIEVTSRIYSAFYPTMKPYTEVGMVSVGPAGSAGAAAACAKLLGMDATHTLHAMANAFAQAGWCPAEVIFGDGGSAKPLLFGSMPAAAGTAGALQALHGITGPVRILEGPMGYLRTVALSYDTKPLTRKDRWYLESARRKLHACCGYMHSAIDSLIALRQEGLLVDRVARIQVHMASYIIPAVSKSRPPATANEARFHSQYCLALALLGDDVIQPVHSDDYQRFLTGRVSALMPGIELREAPEYSHYHQSRVELFDHDGRLLAQRENQTPKGSPRNPITPEEVWRKLHRLCAPVFPRFDVGTYAERLKGLAAAEDTGWIVRAFPRVARD